jgi:trans-aconitate 2-methyltransferase
MTDWNPTQYLAFADERARPALDLIARLPNRAPRLVHDLGCGPGNSTALLAKAFPSATLTGIDSSHAMIAKAKLAVPKAKFVVGDVAHWKPHPEADLIFSNALFQWLPDHAQHFVRLVEAMKPGAMLAIQMPDTLGEQSHVQMAKMAQRPAYAAKLGKATSARASLLSPQGYYQILRPLCARLDIWKTVLSSSAAGPSGHHRHALDNGPETLPRSAHAGGKAVLPRGLPQGHCAALPGDGRRTVALSLPAALPARGEVITCAGTSSSALISPLLRLMTPTNVVRI